MLDNIIIRADGEIYQNENYDNKLIVEGLERKAGKEYYLQIRASDGNFYEDRLPENNEYPIAASLISVPGFEILQVSIIECGNKSVISKSRIFSFSVKRAKSVPLNTPPTYEKAQTLARRAITAADSSEAAASKLELTEIYEIESGAVFIPVSEPTNIKISYIKGGNYQHGDSIISSFGENEVFSYGSYGENNEIVPFDFPEMHSFDEYDGQEITRRTSSIVSITSSGEWVVDDLAGNAEYIAVKTALSDFGTGISVPKTDDDEATVWAEPNYFGVTCLPYNRLHDKPYGPTTMAVKGEYLYVSFYRSAYESATGSVRELVISFLSTYGCQKLKFRLISPTEIIDYGEKYVRICPSKAFYVNAPPIQLIRFKPPISPVVKRIKQGDDTYFPKNGTVDIPAPLFKRIEMLPLPLTVFDGISNIGIFDINEVFFGVNSDDRLIFSGLLVARLIDKASASPFFNLFQLPTWVSVKIGLGSAFIVPVSGGGLKYPFAKMSAFSNGVIAFYPGDNFKTLENVHIEFSGSSLKLK